MVEVVHLNQLIRDPTVSVQNYKDFLNFVTCQPVRENCFLGLYIFCRKIEEIAELLENNFEQHAIDRVEYKSWLATGCCNLKTVRASVE